MRTVGAISHARGLTAHDHVCWCYADRTEFRARAGEFLAEGVAAGERAWYLTADPDEDGPECAETSLVGETYGSGRDPVAQAETFAAAAEDSVRAGYRGLRVAADVTPFARSPEQLEVFAHYEHLADRVMATYPVAGMCGYDRRVLDERTCEQLAAMHPVGNAHSPVRLYAHGTDGVAIAGELDLTCRELLPWALEHAGLPSEPRPLPNERRTLSVDAKEVSFLDHHSLTAIVDHAHGRGFDEVVLHTPLGYPEWLVELLELPGVRVERVP